MRTEGYIYVLGRCYSLFFRCRHYTICHCCVCVFFSPFRRDSVCWSSGTADSYCWKGAARLASGAVPGTVVCRKRAPLSQGVPPWHGESCECSRRKSTSGSTHSMAAPVAHRLASQAGKKATKVRNKAAHTGGGGELSSRVSGGRSSIPSTRHSRIGCPKTLILRIRVRAATS